MIDGDPPDRRLRILHLAYEDHRSPGSGGGGMRTHEINRRLARRHDITTVVARHPGARPRIEDGVSYRPLGLPLGRWGSNISYHLALPWFVMRHPADLVVEDFAAPNSSDLIPLWTRTPTVAVVQWLSAAEKSRQYRLPFWILEETGTRLHHHFVTVSRYIADCIHDINAEAVVDVVYAGVAAPPAVSPAPPRRDLLYLGRLETHMKGLDLLVDAFDEVHRYRPEIRLRIAGDGPGRSQLELLLSKRGLLDKVDWLGRLDGAAKWAALRSALIMIMPSRFETFGLVVLEAMGVGTPVVAFDLPPLREIVAGTSSAVLVKPEHGVGLGRAVSELLGDPARQRQMSEAATRRSVAFDWDHAAAAQERTYRAAVSEGRAPEGRTARLRSLLGAVLQRRSDLPARPVPV